MIVKNEAARIERCLRSVLPWIGCYAIVDTGSSDNTPDKIHEVCRGIPGDVVSVPFEDFSTSRNRALDLARSHPAEFDYLLLADADMELVVEDRGWLSNLAADAYRLIQKNGALTYRNTRLLSRSVPSRYIGATHEYLDVTGMTGNLDGAWFIDHADGANREGKFTRDIALLQRDLERDPDNARSLFYLAQSHRDLGNYAEAAKYYRAVLPVSQWDEEAYYAQLGYARALRDG